MAKTAAILLLLCLSCAKIPVESLRLSSALIEEGRRMHDLNILLINALFKSKREKIDMFIREEYTPQYVSDFMSRVPEGTNLTEEMPGMISSMIPEINKLRDEMQEGLENQRIKLVTKLNQDYDDYNEIALELYFLLESSTKVDEERKELLSKLNQQTGDRIDIEQIEKSLDNYIIKSGDIGEKINDLSDQIDKFIKN